MCSVAKANTVTQLKKLAVTYFHRPVRIEVPFILNGSGTGVIPYYAVEKKRKYYHIVKL